MRPRLLIKALARFFSCPKARRELFGHAHFLAGKRIVPSARVALLDGECTKSSQFHAFASRQRLDDFPEDRVDDAINVALIEMWIARPSRCSSSDLIANAAPQTCGPQMTTF